jgi:DNA replication initiation complex subunit (GINS family)
VKVKIRLLRGNLELEGLRELNEGEEVEVEEWTARNLIGRGLAELAEPLDLAELRRMILAEEREKGLRKLPDDFLLRLSLSLQRAGEAAAQMREAAEELLEVRVQKMLANLPSRDENMLPEEASLFNLLSADLERWKEEMKRGMGI